MTSLKGNGKDITELVAKCDNTKERFRLGLEKLISRSKSFEISPSVSKPETEERVNTTE